MIRPALVASALLAAALSACAPGNRNVPCRTLGTSTPMTPNPAFSGPVVTIVMENQPIDGIIGNAAAPYINSLASQYAIARGYTDAFVHPSEPNYLWMVAGENFGILDDKPPHSNHFVCTSHVADQIERAGLDWKSYQESMGAPCGTDDNYPYLPKHNPFVYFDDINGWNASDFTFSRPPRCVQHVVDYSQLDVDLTAGNLPRYLFITPNMLDDMHDGSVADGDAWLAREVPKILASPAFQKGGVLFLTWDEGSSLGNNSPPMIVVSPLVKRGYVSDLPYTTSSYLKTVEAILGLEALPCDPNPEMVPLMSDLFTAPLTVEGPAPISPDGGAPTSFDGGDGGDGGEGSDGGARTSSDGGVNP